MYVIILYSCFNPLPDLSALTLLPESDQALSTLALTDLLVLQLHAEVRELWARGLHRRYEPNHAWLKSPKGRIDINALAKQKLHDALAVPCTFSRGLRTTRSTSSY